jgi:hypothetical protein
MKVLWLRIILEVIKYIVKIILLLMLKYKDSQIAWPMFKRSHFQYYSVKS